MEFCMALNPPRAAAGVGGLCSAIVCQAIGIQSRSTQPLENSLHWLIYSTGELIKNVTR